MASVSLLVAAPLGAETQQFARAPRIGVVRVGAPPDPAVEGLRQGLRELGYVEGRTIAIEYRWAEGKPDRLNGLAAELVRLRVDVIVTGGQQATQAVMRATNSVPIVTGTGATPITGLVASLARPGGNVTGLTLVNVELSAKKVQLLTEVLPGTSRVAFLGYPAHPSYELVLRETQRAAQALGVHIVVVDLRNPGELEQAFAAMTRARVDAFITNPDETFFAHRRRILDFAAKIRLPGVFDTRVFVEEGAFMAYGPSVPDQFRRAATYVDKILKGAKPSDLPVEQPTKFELVINLKTAKALGLTIPPSLLVRADQVIE
jgi:putative ABC transport system substrate-binding protein